MATNALNPDVVKTKLGGTKARKKRAKKPIPRK